jgi:hypothetical protein
MLDGMRTLATLAAALLLALAGCGSDDDNDDSGAESGAGQEMPEPEQPLEEYVDQLAAALGERDCAELKRLEFQIPCPPTAQSRPAFEDVEVSGVEQFGTGGVADFTSGEAPQGATWVLTIGEKGTWGVFRGEITGEKSVGTELGEREPFDEALDGFLAAVEEGDCKAFFRYSVTASRNERTACREELPLYDQLGEALGADPDAKPFFIGGNARYAFYGLNTDEPEKAYRTVIVSKQGPPSQPHLVLVTLRGPAS